MCDWRDRRDRWGIAGGTVMVGPAMARDEMGYHPCAPSRLRPALIIVQQIMACGWGVACVVHGDITRANSRDLLTGDNAARTRFYVFAFLIRRSMYTQNAAESWSGRAVGGQKRREKRRKGMEVVVVAVNVAAVKLIDVVANGPGENLKAGRIYEHERDWLASGYLARIGHRRRRRPRAPTLVCHKRSSVALRPSQLSQPS